MNSRFFAMALFALSASACSSSSDGMAGSGGTGGVSGTGGTGGGSTSTVSGIVFTRDDAEMPVSGATISVLGTNLSTTSSSTGEFVLEDVPDGLRFFATSAPNSWGVVVYWRVPEETGDFQIGLDVVPDSEVQSVAGALGRTLSEDDGIVQLAFDVGIAGGETGMLSAASDPAFTFNVADEPVVQPGVIVNSEGFGDLIYTSVDPADGPITAEAIGVPGTTVCVLDAPDTDYPILAKSLTLVFPVCEPAP